MQKMFSGFSVSHTKTTPDSHLLWQSHRAPALGTKPALSHCWQVRPPGPRSGSLPGLQGNPFLCQLSQLLLHCRTPGKVNLTQGSSNLNDDCMIMRLCVVFHRPGLFSGGVLTNGSSRHTSGSHLKALSLTIQLMKWSLVLKKARLHQQSHLSGDRLGSGYGCLATWWVPPVIWDFSQSF